MKNAKVLFLAYLYPPVGGKGLPGVHRSVKFVRYLSNTDCYILTVKHELYPEFFSTDNTVDLPINGEIITRTGCFDLFQILLSLRRFILEKTATNDDRIDKEIKKISSGNPLKKKGNGIFSGLKDMLSGVLTFPDYAHGWIVPALWRGRKLVRNNKIDVIFATGMPWSSLVIGYGLKILTGAKLIVDFRDPWIGNPFSRHGKNLKFRVEKNLEKLIVKKADAVTLNTMELKNEFILRYPDVKNGKFHTVPNGYDVNDFKMLNLSEACSGQRDTLVVSHVGYLYGLRDPRQFLEALILLKDRDPELADRVIFQQIGHVSLDYDLKEFIGSHGLKNNYRYISHISHSECLKLMAASDILLVIQQETMTQIPSKLYEYIYLNKPIVAIANPNGALGNMIREFHFGDLFELNNIDEMTECLQLYAEKKMRKGSLDVHYKYASLFDVRKISNKLSGIIERIRRNKVL